MTIDHLELPSLDILKKSLNLDIETGILTHKKKYGAVEGSVAGNVMPSGYIRIKVKGKLYLAHRLIYKMYFNKDPLELEVDHINGDKTNNNPTNLRLATRCENRQNQGIYKSNRLGVKGVYFNVSKNAYFVGVQCNLKRKQYGPFKTKKEAGKFYQNKARSKFKSFYRKEYDID